MLLIITTKQKQYNKEGWAVSLKRETIMEARKSVVHSTTVEWYPGLTEMTPREPSKNCINQSHL